MSLIVYTSKPHGLLRHIKEAINEDKIKTWTVDSDGDFTHTPEQWNKMAWMRKSEIVEGEKLIFGILGRANSTLSKRGLCRLSWPFCRNAVSPF